MKLLQIFIISLALFAFNITSIEPTRTKRVAGRNTKAKPGQFPHAVFLYWFWHVQPFRQLTRFKCTGNLLSSNWVVTVAHCYYHALFSYRNYSSSADFVLNLTMKQGSTKLTKQGSTFIRAGSVDGFARERGWQERSGAMVYLPASYTRPSTMFDMDVALILLQVPFVVDKPHISHVAVARISQVPAFDDYRECIAAGYGYVNAKDMQLVIQPDYRYGTMSVSNNKLHYYKVKFALNNFCKYLQKQLNGQLLYFDEFYGCGKSVGTIKNYTYAQSCFGDGGGPLMCDGLLTGVAVQRRELEPCDFFTSDTAFTMFTLLGAYDVQAWIRRRVKDLPAPVPLPPWDPWDATDGSPEELRKMPEGVVDGGKGGRVGDVGWGREGMEGGGEDGVGNEGGKDDETGNGEEWKVDEAGQVMGRRKGDVSDVEGRKEDEVEDFEWRVGDSLENVEGKKEDEVGSFEESKKGEKENARPKVEERVMKVGYNKEDKSLSPEMIGVKTKREEKQADNYVLKTQLRSRTKVNTGSVVSERSSLRSTLSEHDNSHRKRSRRQDGDVPVVIRSQRRNPQSAAETADGSTAGEPEPRRAKIRRNADGGIVDGDIRDDDPDLVTLLRLIRGGGVKGDPVRRKRHESRLRLREDMAKELLSATRDLDPRALHRLGMGADVLFKEDVGDDEWAREVWNYVFEDDKV